MFKKIGTLLLSGSIVLGLAACDEAEISEVSGEEEKKEKKEEVKKFSVGDSVEFDGMKITLNEARIEEGGEFDEPIEEQFVVANLTIENGTDEEQAVSSIMNIELKDDEGYTYNTTILTEGTKGQLDGTLAPGESMKGDIPFDVSKSDKYELHFSDPFKSGKAIWTIDNL